MMVLGCLAFVLGDVDPHSARARGGGLELRRNTMSSQNKWSRSWSGIFPHEIRMGHMGDSRHCAKSPKSDGRGPRSTSIARAAVKAVSEKLGFLLARSSPASLTTSCADPLDAYIQACLAAPLFCYVSPELYGLITRNDNRGATRVDADRVDCL